MVLNIGEWSIALQAKKKCFLLVFNLAQYIDGRREMMQWYADYMDELEHNSN